MSTECG